MFSKPNYFFHPYETSFLSFHGTNVLSNDNHTFSMITEIDLYDQPVPDPFIAAAFSVIMTIQVPIGEYLHWKVFCSMKKENSIHKLISQIFIVFQMLLWPLTIFMITITNFLYPLNEIIDPWFCSLVQPINSFLILSTVSHSFITSLMRYVFIVHSEKVNRLGKESVKKMFLFLSIALPLLITIWKEIDGSELHFISYFNKCKAKHDRVFLIETSTTNVLKKSFCAMEPYDERNPISFIFAILKQIFCAASTFTIVIIGSNFTEGIVYFKLFSFITR